MKIVAITGGGQGIGRATALHFAKAGYAVSIADADAAAGREAAKILRETGAPAFFLRTDISKEKDVAAWMQATVRELGCPDVLINNAGFSRNGPFLKLKPKDFDAVIATNLRGAFLCSQAAARRMAARKKGGAIVNIASTRAFMSEANTEAYTASKGGIAALTHGMAMSLAPYRIRVNCVSPGWIEVRDWKLSSRARAPVHSKTDKEQHPAGRVGRPEDVAEACLFLADHAGFVTGQNLTVDGGMTIKMIYAE